MSTANTRFSRVFYKGRDEDFTVFVENEPILNRWRDDRSIALTRVVSGWYIFITAGRGAQGILNKASNASLENEFGTSKEDDCITKILETGEFQTFLGRVQPGDKDTRSGPAMVSR